MSAHRIRFDDLDPDPAVTQVHFILQLGAVGLADLLPSESVIGSPYRLSCTPSPNGGVIPSITGQAFIMAEARLIFDPADPFRNGIGT
ncbi:proline racemase family protein [Aliiroseovarius halocynthiae]|uniref:proline racemase family protein n=1 Tax=Aliiroseovarius halocynthiae TaxID=985055 RepID=UPI0024831A72|nr:proline racemase family protein [Aliiroseovarius halocynthiae]